MKNKYGKKFCLIQITRIGDILQTLQLARMFKEKHSDISLSLISRSQFGKPLEFLLEQTFDKLYFLDFKKITSQSTTFQDIQNQINEFAQEVSNDELDVLINLSFSKSSNYLCSIIEAKHKLGTRMDLYNQVEVNDQWSQLVFSMVMGGPNNPFNLIDIYKNILGFESEPKNIPQTKTRNRNLKVIVHPFSSHPKKNWKISKWIEIFLRTLKFRRDLTIYIVGSKVEFEKAEIIVNDPILARFQGRVQNLCGKTTIKELYETLNAGTHFIGHDSMVGHLAKLANKPTLTFALGTVRSIETTPYGKNSFIISPKTKCFPCFPKENCDYYQCHADINFQGAATIVELFLNTGTVNYNQIKDTIPSFYLDNIDIYESHFHESGFMELKQINSDYPTMREIFRKFLRISYLFKFSEKEEHHDYPPLTPQTYAKLLNLKTGIQHLYELSEFGKKYSKEILTEVTSPIPSIEKIKDLSQKIEEIDQLKQLLKQSFHYLSPIVDFYETVKGNMYGDNIVELSESSYIIYQDCSVISSIIYDLIEKTLKEYQIKSGKSADQNSNHGD